MASRGPAHPERSFGVSVGAALLVIAAIFVWRGRPVRAEVFGAVGLVLLVLGRVAPRWLAWPSALWWRLARALGYVNARILLLLLFTLVLVPLSAIWRLIGEDPLARRREASKGWTPYPPRYRDRLHYRRMF